MDNKEFNKLLVKYNLLSLKAARMVDFISNEYKLNNKNEILTVISVIFSFEYLGHCYTPLKDLKNKYLEILNSQETLEKEESDDESISEEFKDLKDTLDLMDIEGFTGCTSIIGDDKFFIVKDDMIFINKYYWASRGIKESFNKLFKEHGDSSNAAFDKSFIKLELNKEQEEAIEKGLNYNLLITGGPGTGKTSTIVFLLLNLLKDKSKEELESGTSFVRENSVTYSAESAVNSNVKYDLIGKLVDETGLTRKAIVKILQGIQPYTFDQFKNNPEEFIIKTSALINDQKATAIIEHITYDIMDEKYGTDVFTEPTIKGKLDVNAMKAKKHLYDHIIYDSTNERKFAEELDTNSNVAVYVKLPDGFYISTPVGHYNPDWAIAFYEGTVKHIYFVAETKGSMNSMQLRLVEESKIHCAREHFKAISNGEVIYDVIDSYSSLLDFVTK